MRTWLLAGCALCSATIAHASDTPRYAPAPAWVVPAPAIDVKTVDTSQPVLIFDAQQRIERDVTTAYLETAMRATTAQSLGELGNVAIPWMPDRGDLIVHTAEIIRGDQKIDLLKSGERFTVLRREQQLEQRLLTGMLTATMTVQGLQVGDVLHVAFSVSQADKALAGRAVAAMVTPTQPLPLRFGRARLLWPASEKVAWRSYGTGAVVKEATVGGDREVTIALPLPRPAELPGDQPTRFVRPPLLEATTFGSWEEVSRTLAPLYATDGLFAPGSALATEQAAIAKATADPLARAQAALNLVQDKVRYLAVAMNGGGLTPQTPARTWELRYGDCKAKTLLLLALLRGLGVEAEPVVVSAQLGGFVDQRLPSPIAFDHILVRATVAGRTLWLDGTGAGAMLADIDDTPGFRWVLPLRPAGATLTPLPMHADARPSRIVTVRYDQRAGIGMPTLFDTRITMRGAMAQLLDTMAGAADAKQKTEFIQRVVGEELGAVRLATSGLVFDKAAGTATITATGIMTTPWDRADRVRKLALDRASDAIAFAPDRARATWRALPAATPDPEGTVYHTTVLLPQRGAGFAFEGATTLPATLAGRKLSRTVSLSEGIATVEDRIDATGAEIAAADIPVERARVAQFKARPLRLVAPATLPDRAATIAAAIKNNAFAPIEAAYAAQIANDPQDADTYVNRANFRTVYDRKAALADLARAIAIEDKAETRLQRGHLYEALGNTAAAQADYAAARTQEPANLAALRAFARLEARAGRKAAALAMVEERLASGGSDERVDLLTMKADLQADSGDVAGGIATLDAAIAERPGNPDLLNARCWMKGTRNVSLDTALKDCTKAIELSDDPAAAMDSRAMAYFRMGRRDEALTDLEVVLARNPDMAASRYLRGLVYAASGKAAEATSDLAAARLLSPQIDADYARWGLKP